MGSQVGKTVKKLAKHENKEVVKHAESLMKTFKKVISRSVKSGTVTEVLPHDSNSMEIEESKPNEEEKEQMKEEAKISSVDENSVEKNSKEETQS